MRLAQSVPSMPRKPKFKPNRYKKKPGIPKSVSKFMAAKGSIGGKISAHKRYGTKLPPELQIRLAIASGKTGEINVGHKSL